MVRYASSQNAVKLFLKRFTAASGTDVEIVQKFLFFAMSLQLLNGKVCTSHINLNSWKLSSETLGCTYSFGENSFAAKTLLQHQK